jgi:ABC-type arginine transport system ATPase subunit
VAGVVITAAAAREHAAAGRGHQLPHRFRVAHLDGYQAPAAFAIVATMLHMIGALERPDSGTIMSDRTEVTALRGAALADYRRTVGFVFQRYNLLPTLTVLDNVIAPVLPYRTGWNKRDRARARRDLVAL